MDYQEIDRIMSSHVVTCCKNGVRFFLGEDGTATDMLSRAKLYRYPDLADKAANSARLEYAWQGFRWHEMTYPHALIAR